MEKPEAIYHNQLVNRLRPYIMAAKREQGITSCERCASDVRLEINHKRYGEDVTLKDLELLCEECHSNQTGWANDMRLAGSYCSHCQRPF